MARSPQTLSVEDRRLVASWAADCAEHVLALYEDAVPGDVRPRAAIEQARSFAAGALELAAAEQAAAVAHMGAHALGAAGYAANASTLAVGCDDETVTSTQAHRQATVMTPAVARVLSLLPALGTDRAGPLGPGRLATRHVGEAIRAIQAQLPDR